MSVPISSAPAGARRQREVRGALTNPLTSKFQDHLFGPVQPPESSLAAEVDAAPPAREPASRQDLTTPTGVVQIVNADYVVRSRLPGTIRLASINATTSALRICTWPARREAAKRPSSISR
jgi:hypothetical protein